MPSYAGNGATTSASGYFDGPDLDNNKNIYNGGINGGSGSRGYKPPNDIMAQPLTQSTVPVPDPTLLTTQQLIRELASLREIIETRLAGMDKAIELIQHSSDVFPERIDEKIASLKEIHEEKFRSIQVQFAERDTRAEQTSRDNKVAIDAALQAAKEAVGEQNKSSAVAIAKSEASTSKQIDQLGNLIATTAKGSDDKIDDIKERLTRIEGKDEGTSSTQKGRLASNSYIVAVAGFVIGSLIALGGLYLAGNRTPAVAVQPAPQVVVVPTPVPPTTTTTTTGK